MQVGGGPCLIKGPAARPLWRSTPPHTSYSQLLAGYNPYGISALLWGLSSLTSLTSSLSLLSFYISPPSPSINSTSYSSALPHLLFLSLFLLHKSTSLLSFFIHTSLLPVFLFFANQDTGNLCKFTQNFQRMFVY